MAVAEHPEDPIVFRNASEFLCVHDPTLAETLLRRGALLDPTSPAWSEGMARLRRLAAVAAESDDERQQNAHEALHEYERALAVETSPLGRYGLLIEVATTACESGDYLRAKEVAICVLAEADDFKKTWQYGNGIHHGHIVLGQCSLALDDLAGACDHLAAAGETPGSPQLNSSGPDFTLATAILARGERKAVIGYLESCKRFWRSPSPVGSKAIVLERWKSMVERGETPSFIAWEDDA